MQAMHLPLGVEFSTALLVIVGAFSVLLLILIVVAPWRQVRAEPPMDKAVEAKLLLHRDPDEPTGEVPRVTAMPSDDEDDLEDGDLSDLAALDEPQDPESR
jgi:hypothetical protein